MPNHLKTEKEVTRPEDCLSEAQQKPETTGLDLDSESNQADTSTNSETAPVDMVDESSLVQHSEQKHDPDSQTGANGDAVDNEPVKTKTRALATETPDVISETTLAAVNATISETPDVADPEPSETPKYFDSEVSDGHPKMIPKAPCDCSEIIPEAAGTNTVQPPITLESFSHTLNAFCQQTSERLDALEKLFRLRLIYDETKETQIRELHAELQAHKKGLLDAALKPYIKSLIRTHDNMGRALADIEVQLSGNDEGIRVEQFVEIFKGFRDELELILDQNGIETFITDEDRFDPRQQQALRRVTVDDASLRGQVAERIRAGFRQGDTIIQKERVAVYV